MVLQELRDVIKATQNAAMKSTLVCPIQERGSTRAVRARLEEQHVQDAVAVQDTDPHIILLLLLRPPMKPVFVGPTI